MSTYEQVGPDGKVYFVVDLTWSDPKTGKRSRIRRAAKDKKGRPAKSRTAAEQHEHRIREALAAGTFEQEERADSPVPELASYFTEKYLPDARVRLKPQTVDYYERTFRNAVEPTLGTTTMDAIDAAAVAGLTRVLHGRELGPKSINNALSTLRATLAHAAEHDFIAALPLLKWQKLPPAKFDFFTFEEAAKLLVHAPPIVVLAVRTGMRIGELLALRWSDVSLDRKSVTVARSVWWAPDGTKHEGAPKNHKARTIPLTTDAHAALSSLPARSGYVFVDEAGVQETPGASKWPLWRAQDAAGLRRTGPHVLRHTFASHLVMRGVSLPAVQALMGHGTIAMTMKYAHLAPDHLRSAIDALEA